MIEDRITMHLKKPFFSLGIQMEVFKHHRPFLGLDLGDRAGAAATAARFFITVGEPVATAGCPGQIKPCGTVGQDNLVTLSIDHVKWMGQGIDHRTKKPGMPCQFGLRFHKGLVRLAQRFSAVQHLGLQLFVEQFELAQGMAGQTNNPEDKKGAAQKYGADENFQREINLGGLDDEIPAIAEKKRTDKHKENRPLPLQPKRNEPVQPPAPGHRSEKH